MTTTTPSTTNSGQYAEYIIQENDVTIPTKLEHQQQQQQQSISHWNHESVQDAGGGSNIQTNNNGNNNNNNNNNTNNNNTSNNNNSHHPTSSAASSEEGHQQQQQHHNQSTNSTDRSLASIDSGMSVKTPNSYKYPLLRQYYNFGPWIGRNRKAICLRCRLQTSSSQPDRLLKHLNKCPKLSEAEKIAVQDLMNERTANKRKKPTNINNKSRTRDDNNDDTTEYYGVDKPMADDCGNPIPIPPGGLKKLRREHTDRTSQIDEALTRFIMMCRIPLKAIHSQEFVDLVRALDPEYRIPSRETITNVLIPGMLNII